MDMNKVLTVIVGVILAILAIWVLGAVIGLILRLVVAGAILFGALYLANMLWNDKNKGNDDE